MLIQVLHDGCKLFNVNCRIYPLRPYEPIFQSISEVWLRKRIDNGVQYTADESYIDYDWKQILRIHIF